MLVWYFFIDIKQKKSSYMFYVLELDCDDLLITPILIEMMSPSSLTPKDPVCISNVNDICSLLFMCLFLFLMPTFTLFPWHLTHCKNVKFKKKNPQ
jgi:hypothetical protein